MRASKRKGSDAVRWLDLMSSTMLLGVESQRVIALRLMKLAAGGPASLLESQWMVTEKIAAMGVASTTLLGGGSLHTVVRHYRAKVRANQRRLAEPGPARRRSRA